MPYINKEDRTKLQPLVDFMGMNPAHTVGELNYLISKLCECYLLEHGHRYQQFNDVIGAIENAKFELVRRLIQGYEDEKIVEHGDVYEKILESMKVDV